jgi:hypothetical protein
MLTINELHLIGLRHRSNELLDRCADKIRRQLSSGTRINKQIILNIVILQKLTESLSVL